MSIKQITPDKEVDRYLEDFTNRAEKALLYNLAYIGEQVLNAARSTDSYRDQTRNLRSSLGYVLVKDGKIVTLTGFKTVKTGQAGTLEGKAYARELAARFPQGIALIVVAGMEYASYVSAKGYDVLDSSELLAERLIPQMLKDLGFTK